MILGMRRLGIAIVALCVLALPRRALDARRRRRTGVRRRARGARPDQRHGDGHRDREPGDDGAGRHLRVRSAQLVAADFNTAVKRGQLLARIDPRPFQVKVDDARAAVANARARREKDRAAAALKAVTLGRTRALQRDGIVSKSDLDLAESEERQARSQLALDEADIQSAEARVREAEVSLAYTDIVSPVDGTVVARNVDVGQTVAASFQTPTLFLVAEDLTKMQVNASVSESDIGTVATGQDAAFSVDAFPADTFRGSVAQVRNAPITVLNVVTYDVIIGVDNTDLRLRPGMTANVTITTAHRDDVLRVPTRALRFRPPDVAADGAVAAAPARQPGARVWVLDASRAPEERAVETGIADDQFTEIRSGLDEGARVITRGEARAGRAGRRRLPLPPEHAARKARPVIDARGLEKTYALNGETPVAALRGVSFRIAAGRAGRDHGRIGFRQVDAPESARLPRPADGRRVSPGRHRRGTPRRRRARGAPATRRSASSSRASTCCRAPPRSRTWSCRWSTGGCRRRSIAPGPRPRSARSGSASSPRGCRRSSPAGSSSASPSRGRSWPSRG
jgi:HlyD family secretion protein